MKPEISKVLTPAAMALAFALASCVTEVDRSVVFGPGEGQPVVIAFHPGVDDAPSIPAPPETRAYHNPGELSPGNGEQGSPAIGRAPEDIEVTDIRVLLYKSSTGQFVAGDQALVAERDKPVELELVTGLYDVVLVANASSDTNLVGPAGKLNNVFGNPGNYNTLPKVGNALLDHRAFDSRAAGGLSRPIPMFALVRDVHISLDGSVQVADGPSQNTHTTPWAPILRRAGVRLSMEITLNEWQWRDWVAAGSRIEITRLPVESWLWNSGKFNGDTDRRLPDTQPRTYTASANDSPTAGYDGYTTRVAADRQAGKEEQYVVRFDRIIVPELLFDDTDNADLAAVLSIDLGGDLTVSGHISGPNPATSKEGFTLPRNLWLHLEVSIAGSRLEVIPKVIEWNTYTGGGTIDNKEWLRVKGPVYIADTWPQSFEATTSLDGITVMMDGASPKIEYIDDSGWLSLTQDSPATHDTDGTTTRRITVRATTDNTGRYRRARVWVTAGEGDQRLVKQIEVIHTSGIHASPGVIGYVASGPHYGTLTLRGSRRWAGTEVGLAADAMFPGEGGLHPQTVYTALFKWGSLVALSSELTDPAFDPGDMVAAPPDYNHTGYPAPALDAVRRAVDGEWGRVPFRDGEDAWINGWKSEPVKALGDPCAYYFKDWRLPVGGAGKATGQSARANGGWNGGTFGKSDDMTGLTHTDAHSQWLEAGSVGPGTPAAIRAGDQSPGHPQEWTMLLPAAGYRYPFGGGASGQGFAGMYWSSEVELAEAIDLGDGTMSNPGINGYSLTFYNTHVFPSNFYDLSNAFAVRCVGTIAQAER